MQQLLCATRDSPPDSDDPTTLSDEADDEVCRQAYARADGTPICFFRIFRSPPPYEWACGILCGDLDSEDLGDCPEKLSCSGNLCL
jgi:hypothetical protein